MRRRVSALLCVLLVSTLVVGVVPASAQSDTEETRLEIQLENDGDARWTIVATVPLENQSDVDNFRSFAEAFENGERDFQLGVDVFERAATEASAASGREMNIQSTSRDSAIVNETEADENVSRHGELSVSFTWTSFARQDENGTLYVDDAFNTTDGTWLPGLEEGQTLIIRSPPGYGGPSTSPIGADGGDLRWEGPQTFEPGYFEIVYPQLAPSEESGISTVLLAGAVLLSAAALALGLYLLWRRSGGVEPSPAGPPAEGEAADDAASNGGTDAESTTSGGESPDASGAEPDAGAAEPAPDPELLSDEERVEYLLEQNGGRMKQANIVKETGWSNAKVSQLLSSMADEGRVDKLRIGRENLISLPGESVGDLGEDAEE
ncbi:MAG: hypothetical protein ACI8UR_001598 [Natronomonas sp.]|jgi:hypothetical protein|uniref:helix-turn-helix transcriptional regulator n=1 Tax=Natronomonas sp. TaxID=2184060 RepID=UPI00398971CA